MKTVKVKPNQCLEDLALEHYGAIEGVELLLRDNRTVLSDGFMTALSIGLELQVRETPLKVQVHQQMRRKGIIPASDSGTNDQPSNAPDFNAPDFNDNDFETEI